MPQPLLPEYVGPNVIRESASEDPFVRIVALEKRIDSLARGLEDLKAQIKALNHENLLVIWRLLSPLYKSLQPIFGEMEAGGVGDLPGTSTGKQAQWESVKQRLQPRHREVIDILLLQGEMGRKQIASAIKMDYTNCCKNVIGPLIRQGWLVESGGKIALKNL